MEPTIRKGEQSREEDNQLDPAAWDDLVEQEPLPEEGENGTPEEQTQPRLEEELSQILSDEYDQLENADQPGYIDEADLNQAGPDEVLENPTSTPASDTLYAIQPVAGEQVSTGLQADPGAELETEDTDQPEPAEEAGRSQFTGGVESFPDEFATPPSPQSEPQFAGQIETIAPLPESLPSDNPSAPLPADFLPMPAFEEVQPESNPRKIALVLSGGGARGAFQVGAEKYAREVKGYQWDIIAGVSVGALNGAMLAMHRFLRLLELWDHISNSQVYTGGFNLVALVKILFGAKSFYGNEPLKKMMQSEFEAGRILDDLHVGAVSLISGEYVQFTRESLELSKAILASASIPVVWPPVDVSADHPAMVDGGVRNITPIGDVLALEPDEIVIINCGNEKPTSRPEAASNVLSIGMRALDIMQNEIFLNDMKDFLRINALVKEASQQGVVLHHPQSGRPLKYFPCKVIEPDSELGDVLDFSQKSIQAALKAGVRRAREVLGRP